jgi:hypothetical protein
MDAEELLAALKTRLVFPPDPLIDSICRSSNGYLIYREQIEELYMHLTLCDESEAIKFRKDWNKKSAAGRAVARSLAYSDNMTLEDVIQQRKIADGFDFFVSARYRELENLSHGIRNHPRTN